MDTSIGQLIKQARQRAGISQASLALRAGTSQAAISRIERGLEQPGPERVEAILTSLGLRLRVEVEPIMEPYADRGQLMWWRSMDPESRLRGGLKSSRFISELAAAARGVKATTG